LDKASLRASARAMRKAIAPEDRASRSLRIAEHALALPELAKARAVGVYASFGSEVDTTPIVRALLARGMLVAVPTTRGDRLVFVRLQHPWALERGPKGAPEPRQPWTEVDGESLAVVFVPGLLFGKDGSRLGMGGGHYDRFLRAHPTPLRVGLAFSEQVVDSAATEEHDEGVDVLVTEAGRQRTGRPAD
jgi:5-formyltetrahydrofolate cyclo-ligase